MIKAGDLVMVVRGQPCCGKSKALGAVFKVGRVRPVQGSGHCVYCNEFLVFSEISVRSDDGRHRLFEKQLKRIDPPALDETTETDEELMV